MSQTKNVVCPGCTLLCDDIEIKTGGSKTDAKNACEKGQSFFDLELSDDPVHLVSGKQTELDAAINAAADILINAQSPLICGLDQLTTQAQQTAWKIADRIGANIDTMLTNAGRSSMFSLQRVGKVTASLGEIASRSDLVVFWFCDPESTHPRLLERLNRSNEHPRRRIIVIDEQETKTSRVGDEHIQINRDSAAAVLATLRAHVVGLELDEDRVLETTGLESGDLKNLATQLCSAKYGSVFYGQATKDSSFDLETDSLHSIVRELNDVTRFVSMKLRLDANAQSAENVLAWSTGYPFAVSHNRDYPRFNWLEYSAESILARRECDAVLFVAGNGKDPLSGLSETNCEFLGSIPTIALSPIPVIHSEVSIQVGVPGLNCSGEFCRNDDVSLPLNSVTGTNSVSPHDVLGTLLGQLS